MSTLRRDSPARPLRASAPLFAALGDETRLALLARLSRGKASSITSLTEGSRLTRQAITKHLRVLQRAGLVRGVRQGRESRFELQPKRLDEARRALEATQAPHATGYPPRIRRAPVPEPGEGEAVLATWHLMLDKGSLQDGEPFLAGTAKAPRAAISPLTAQTHGIVAEDLVTVSADGVRVTLPVEIRAMVDHLGEAHGLSREDAYVLSSLCVDLKISEIVDAGQYIVSAFLPDAVFV